MISAFSCVSLLPTNIVRLMNIQEVTAKTCPNNANLLMENEKFKCIENKYSMPKTINKIYACTVACKYPVFETIVPSILLNAK